jgi:hypothetical protein
MVTNALGVPSPSRVPEPAATMIAETFIKGGANLALRTS